MGFNRSMNPSNQPNQDTDRSYYPKSLPIPVCSRHGSYLSPGFRNWSALGHSTWVWLFYTVQIGTYRMYFLVSMALFMRFSVIGQMCYDLYIHLQMDVWVFLLFDYYKWYCERMCTRLCMEIHFFSSEIGAYLEMELLSCRVHVYLALWEIKLFSKEAVQFYIPTRNAQRFQLLLQLTKIWFCQSS